MESNKLDATDIGILNLLQVDAHLGYKEIGHALKRNKSVIGERIKRLKEQGYILEAVTLVDINKVMPVFQAFTFIALRDHSKENNLLFKERMLTLPQVMECYQITGRYDFKLKIVVNDMAEYNTLLSEQVTSFDFVGKVETFSVIDQAKMTTSYQLK